MTKPRATSQNNPRLPPRPSRPPRLQSDARLTPRPHPRAPSPP